MLLVPGLQALDRQLIAPQRFIDRPAQQVLLSHLVNQGDHVAEGVDVAEGNESAVSFKKSFTRCWSVFQSGTVS